MKNLFLCLLLLTTYFTAFSQKTYVLRSDPNNVIATQEFTGSAILTVYTPKNKNTGTAVIIFPGGAYEYLAADMEGTNVAKAFADSGITSFVVEYRLPKGVNSIYPLVDAQLAIQFVRNHVKEYNVKENKIGIIGYSAGGHLASTLGTHFSTSYIPNPANINLRPDFMILVYPVITMDSVLTHRGSRNNLLGRNPTNEQVNFFSSEKQVTTATPPTYLAHAKDDKLVSVNNSNVFYQALLEKKVPAEIHLYPSGDHGFTTRQQPVEWLSPMLAWMRKGGWLK